MVSVIIPTLQAMPRIARLLGRLRSQSEECEILVVDSSSCDGTVEAAESAGARVLTVAKEDFNHGGTRNFAASRASGDILVFLTQDVLPMDTSCIASLIAPLAAPPVAASYGRQIPWEDARPTEKFARSFNYPEHGWVRRWEDVQEYGMRTFFFSNACSAIRRSPFEEAGGFPEKVIMFEDMLFAAEILKKGYSIAYQPEARVIHSHDLNWTGQFARYLKAGISFASDPRFLQYAGGRKEGLSFLREEVRYLLRRGMYGWCVYALTEGLFKYGGYRLGLSRSNLLRATARLTGLNLHG